MMDEEFHFVSTNRTKPNQTKQKKERYKQKQKQNEQTTQKQFKQITIKSNDIRYLFYIDDDDVDVYLEM